MTEAESYEEWRVTGRWGDEPYEFTWSPRVNPRPEGPGASAREFVAKMHEHGIWWSDGPYLSRRRVTVTEWEAIEP